MRLTAVGIVMLIMLSGFVTGGRWLDARRNQARPQH